MCLGNCIRGRDQLCQDILETEFTLDLPDNCDYIECNNTITIDRDDLSFLELNIHGLYSKIPNLLHLIDNISRDWPPDVLLMCETWLTKHTPTIHVPGYKIYRSDRIGKKGGGVCILTSEKLRTQEIMSLRISNPDLECCGIKVTTNTHPIIALSVYRPPNTNPTNFITQLRRLVCDLRKTKNAGLVIGLDHNLDFLKSSTHKPTHLFLEEIMDLGLLPSISRPTRITRSTATLIDNILIDQKFSASYKSSVIIENLSNHLPCFTTFCGAKPHAIEIKP